MPPDARVLLADVDRAGAEIERFTEGIDGDAYARDPLTQAAVERKFEIIGEALNRLGESHPDLASSSGFRDTAGSLTFATCLSAVTQT